MLSFKQYISYYLYRLLLICDFPNVVNTAYER
jgi:hypothetical protein